MKDPTKVNFDFLSVMISLIEGIKISEKRDLVKNVADRSVWGDEAIQSLTSQVHSNVCPTSVKPKLTRLVTKQGASANFARQIKFRQLLLNPTYQAPFDLKIAQAFFTSWVRPPSV